MDRWVHILSQKVVMLRTPATTMTLHRERMAKGDTTMIYRHGDVLIERVAQLPQAVTPSTERVLAYGEVTGHAHRMQGDYTMYADEQGNLYFRTETGAFVTHEEHARIDFVPGTYKVTHQREYNPFEDAVQAVRD